MGEWAESASALTKLGARLQVLAFRVITAAVDAGSPAIRFGIGHAVRRRLLQRPLLSLTADQTDGGGASARAGSSEPRAVQPVVILVTRALGTGGVEAIVATLAQGLPSQGLDCIVLCEQGGSTADALRALRIPVIEARDEPAALAPLLQEPSVLAAQLHNAPEHLIAACAARGIPLLPVIHTTDINLSADDWMRQSDLFDRSAAVIAVSETVREFTEHHLPRPTPVPVTVVPNGVAARVFRDARSARERLGTLIGTELAETTVFACLARYDMQKNIPGLVRAFLSAVSEGVDAHLIVAGPVGDWLEYSHADAIRRSHPRSARVHLLGSSSSADILDAADAFVLDSFFEGWPVAASEAVMTGLPLVISDVGGARELAGVAASRGVICANPGGAPATITLPQIRSARRGREQVNAEALAAELRTICCDIAGWRSRRERLALDATQWLGADVMVAAHARLLHGVQTTAEDAR